MECKMPDLSDLEVPLIRCLLPKLLAGEPLFNQKTGSYMRNFIRLLDHAIFEYMETRETVLADVAEEKRPTEEMIRTGRQFHFIGFVNHFEACINAVARVLKLLYRIKSEPNAPKFPRLLRRLTENQSKGIKDIRDAIEHMDEIIQKGELRPGQPIMLFMSAEGDKATIGGYHVEFATFASLIRSLYEVARYLLQIA